MNILFDLVPVSPTVQFEGGMLYGENVFFALQKRNKNLIGIYDSERYINSKILESGIKLYDINHISLKEVVEKENIDVFYTFQYKRQDKFQVSVKRYIITWHDVRGLELLYDKIELHYTENFYMKVKKMIDIMMRLFIRNPSERINNKKASVENAEYITDSQHSKHSIIGFYPHLAEKNIPVFYPPLSDELVELSQPRFTPKSYFLLTSSSRWIKNNLRAVWALDELFAQRSDLNFKVILTDVACEKIYAKGLKNKERFVFLNYVERAELLSLHKNAYAFIYPSLNEGFGYPPVESMRYGVPVAASGTTAVPEICQNAAIYFDPYNMSEIKNRILQLLDKDIYTEYSARAVERYKIISERQRMDLGKIVNFILGEKSPL